MVHTKKNKAGFTLVELLVTTSIFVIMTALMVAKYGTFNQGILLKNLAYDIALTIRTAQTYGIGVQGKQATEGSLPNFSYAYGVHFDTANTKAIILFADVYIPLGVRDSTEDISTYNIKYGAQIAGFNYDGTNNIDTNVSNVDISFLRPNPDAKICLNSSSSCSPVPYIKIFIKSSDGTVQNVVVRQTGQVSINE